MTAHSRRDLELPTPEMASFASEATRSIVTHIRNIADDEVLRLSFEDGTPVELPAYALRRLIEILDEVSKGNAVTLVPVHAVLTTQEAADLLNVSRPHLIKLLERGEIDYFMSGSHRRVRFEDLMQYRDKRDEARRSGMEELARIAQEEGMGY